MPCLLLAAITLAATACGTARTAERREAGEEIGERTELTCDSASLAVTVRHSEQTGVQQESVLTVTKEPVAAESSIVRASLASLRDLPEGAGYSSRNGRAGVELARVGDEIVATGSCDSLAREVEWLWMENWFTSERADSLASALEVKSSELERERETRAVLEREVSERGSGGVRAAIKWLLTGVATGGVLTYITVKRWQF